MIQIPRTNNMAWDRALDVIQKALNDLVEASSRTSQGMDPQTVPDGAVRVVKIDKGQYAIQAKTPEGWITSTNIEFVLRDKMEVAREVPFETGTTKTTPGTVDRWQKILIDGVEHYIPCYTSKTS